MDTGHIVRHNDRTAICATSFGPTFSGSLDFDVNGLITAWQMNILPLWTNLNKNGTDRLNVFTTTSLFHAIILSGCFFFSGSLLNTCRPFVLLQSYLFLWLKLDEICCQKSHVCNFSNNQGLIRINLKPKQTLKWTNDAAKGTTFLGIAIDGEQNVILTQSG